MLQLCISIYNNVIYYEVAYLGRVAARHLWAVRCVDWPPAGRHCCASQSATARYPGPGWAAFFALATHQRSWHSSPAIYLSLRSCWCITSALWPAFRICCWVAYVLHVVTMEPYRFFRVVAVRISRLRPYLSLNLDVVGSGS